MRVAAIDIGSNSVRLLIQEGDGTVLHRESQVTGLARGVDARGVLSTAAVEATMRVIRSYAHRTAEARCDVVASVATSAARDATNGRTVMADIGVLLGNDPVIIGGGEEARLSFEGAVAHFPEARERLVIDIGGGSTELVRGGSSVEWAHSYDIGSVRLTDRHLANRPPDPTEVALARLDAQSIFSVPEAPDASHLQVVGVAGTFTNLGCIHLGLQGTDASEVHGTTLGLEHIEGLIARFASLTLEELRAIPAMHPERAPVILGGAIVASAALRAVGAIEVTMSAHGLLDGLAAQLLARG